MRYLVIFIILLRVIPGYAQLTPSKPQPFQVLYSENTKNQLGVPVKSLDLIAIDDTLHIQNGTLSLIHHTGFPVEINSDTIIEIQKLHALIIRDESRMERKQSRRKEAYVIDKRPALDFLFTSTKEEATKNRLSRIGACHDCGPNVRSYPPEGMIYYKNDLCVKWEHKFNDSYYVSIRNLYDEVIKEFPVNTTEISLDITELNRLKMKGETFLIMFKPTEKGGVINHLVLKEYLKQNLELPFPCTLTRASSAVMAGFHNEQLVWGDPGHAEKYYVLATQLSDKEFYKTMLDNFRKRNEK